VREESVLEISVDDVVLMEAVDGIEDRADDSDGVVLGKLALCEDTVLFCARLEALVKLDLGWVRFRWVGTKRETDDVGGGQGHRGGQSLSRRWFRFSLVFFLMTLRAMWWMDELEGVLAESERLEERLRKVSLRLTWLIFFYTTTGNLQQ